MFDKGVIRRLIKVLSNVWQGADKYQAVHHQAGTTNFSRDVMAYQQMIAGWSIMPL